MILTATTAFRIIRRVLSKTHKLKNCIQNKTNHNLYCLAQNVYFEAKSEPLAGQYAVADVVLNRVNDTRYPNTICEVVKEGPIKESWKTKQDTSSIMMMNAFIIQERHRCQFSWYCDGKPDTVRDQRCLAYGTNYSI